jgi:hypothetical protein
MLKLKFLKKGSPSMRAFCEKPGSCTMRSEKRHSPRFTPKWVSKSMADAGMWN